MILSHLTDFETDFYKGGRRILLITRIGVVKYHIESTRTRRKDNSLLNGVKALDGKLRTAVCDRYV
jgi:hypothetical protein